MGVSRARAARKPGPRSSPGRANRKVSTLRCSARHGTGRKADRPPAGARSAAEERHRGRACGGGHAKTTSGGHHKPGSVSAGGILADGPAVAAIHLGRRLPGGSSSQPGSLGAKHACPSCERRETPIRPCSEWGLPCGCRCRPPGALLPHPFTLACPLRERRAIGGLLSVALSLAPPESGTGGRYPPPLFRGARTFLALSHAAASGPLTGRPIGVMPSKY